jgi:hypothetical protein
MEYIRVKFLALYFYMSYTDDSAYYLTNLRQISVMDILFFVILSSDFIDNVESIELHVEGSVDT